MSETGQTEVGAVLAALTADVGVAPAKKALRELKSLQSDAVGLASGIVDEKTRRRAQRKLLELQLAGLGGGSGESSDDDGGEGIVLAPDEDSKGDDPDFVVPEKAIGVSSAAAAPAKGTKVRKGGENATGGVSEVAAPLLALLGSLSTAVNGLKIQLAHLESKVDTTQSQVKTLTGRAPAQEPEVVELGRRTSTAPWKELAMEVDEDDDAAVKEAKATLQQRMSEQAAKKAAAKAGKSTVRLDGLACVESMEGLMRGVGGVATSLEGTLLALLHRLSVDHPTRYAASKAYHKTAIRDRSRAYDVIRSELIAIGKSIYDSVSLERAAEEVSLLYVDIFSPPKANREALKAVIKPDEDFLMQLSGNAERFGLLHMRAKQVSQLGGYASSKGTHGDGEGEGNGGAGAKKK